MNIILDCGMTIKISEISGDFGTINLDSNLITFPYILGQQPRTHEMTNQEISDIHDIINFHMKRMTDYPNLEKKLKEYKLFFGDDPNREGCAE